MAEDSADGGRGQPDPDASPGRPSRTMTPAIAGALVVLAASFALSVAFVLSNGGLDLPAAQRPSSSSSAGNPTPAPTGATATGIAEATVSPPSAGPTASPPPATATARPVATATAGTTPEPTSTPGPSSNRYDLLTRCASAPDCWIYVVREGDNLFSIARYFGVPLSVVEERNPWTKTTQLVAGQELLLPPPTR